MQSAARRLKRISSGQQKEFKRHNNRRRTPGRLISYVPTYREPTEEVIKERNDDMSKVNKYIEGIIKYKALKKLVWKLEKEVKELVSGAEEKLKKTKVDLKGAMKPLLRKRPTVDSTIKLIREEFVEKLVFRTIGANYGMPMPSY